MTNNLMSGNRTKTDIHVAEHLIRLLANAPQAQPSVPLDAVVSILKKLKSPIIFVVHQWSSTGDLLPFQNFLKSLLPMLSGTYHILLEDGGDFQSCRIDMGEHEHMCCWYDVATDWLNALLSAPVVDVILSNQETKWHTCSTRYAASEDAEVRSTAPIFAKRSQDFGKAFHEKNPLHIRVEFQWMDNGFLRGTVARFKMMLKGTCTVKRYQEWIASSTPDTKELSGIYKRLPSILFSAYPAELLTDGELKDAQGIVCGHIPIETIQEDAHLRADVDAFIKQARDARLRVVYIGRGGKKGSSVDVGCLEAAMLVTEIPNVAVILICPIKKLVNEKLLMIEHGAVNHSSIFKQVDVIVHHGGAGTTVTGLQCGVPQIVVPVDCADQLAHGRKVTDLGCGMLLRARENLSEDTNEIVEAVEGILHDWKAFKPNCDEWAAKLANAADGIKVTTDAITRLVAGKMIMEKNGKWKDISRLHP